MRAQQEQAVQIQITGTGTQATPGCLPSHLHDAGPANVEQLVTLPEQAASSLRVPWPAYAMNELWHCSTAYAGTNSSRPWTVAGLDGLAHASTVLLPCGNKKSKQAGWGSAHITDLGFGRSMNPILQCTSTSYTCTGAQQS